MTQGDDTQPIVISDAVTAAMARYNAAYSNATYTRVNNALLASGMPELEACRAMNLLTDAALHFCGFPGYSDAMERFTAVVVDNVRSVLHRTDICAAMILHLSRFRVQS